ncbi:MAG: P22 phage major capsid protein family protein [Candidatus Dormibacteria bacterium]
MSNAFLNATEYANSMLLLAKNLLVTGRLVDGKFKDQVTDENGLIINIKRPPRFVAGSGAALSAQDIVTGSTSVSVNQYTNVHLQIGDLESVQSFNALMRNSSMRSAAQTLASQIDSYLQGLVLGFHGWCTSAGHAANPAVNIGNVQTLMAAHTRLMENGVPLVDIAGTCAPVDGELIRGAMLTNFTPDENVTALERARIPVVSEIDWYATQQTPAMTTGTRTNGAVNGAAQNVNYRSVKSTNTQTIAVNGLGAGGTIAAGEVFTIAGVFAWDWRANGGAGAVLPYLQQFTATSGATADGTGAVAALTISPPIIVQGTSDGVSTTANTAFATVNSIPASAAVVTWVGAASTALRVRAAWTKSAIQLVSARLQTPFTGVASFATDPETGISIRYWRGSDITTGNHIHRWDCIYGATNVDAFMGTRVSAY